MPKLSLVHHVALAPADMYAVVADVERYPEFLPLCEAVEVRSREAVGGGERLVATMTVGYGAIRERLTTRVDLEAARATIRVTHVDGPCRHLHNQWHFRAEPGGTAIAFDLDYEFRSLVLRMTMAPLLGPAVARFTHAFEQRAQALARSRDLDAAATLATS